MLALDCGLVVASIGRRTAPMAGVPYDARAGVHANVGGRIVMDGTVAGARRVSRTKAGTAEPPQLRRHRSEARLVQMAGHGRPGRGIVRPAMEQQDGRSVRRPRHMDVHIQK